MLAYIQDRVQDLKIRQADVSTLARQTALNPVILRFSDFHPPSMTDFLEIRVNTP
jgi:hypothetical protein